MRLVTSSIEGEYRRYKRLAEQSFAQLSDPQLAQPLRDGDNSIATIAWHVAGNLRSRFTDFLTSDGEKPWRDREGEFQPRRVPRAELLDTWEQGWRPLMETLANLTDEDLGRTVTIRNQPLLVAEALHRSLAHTSYHVGQIVFIAKHVRGAEWDYLSIPPGQTREYNQNPTREKPPGSSAR